MPRLLRTATLTAMLLAPGYSSTAGQDQTFRITNIERRLDQLQQRVDFVERQQQNQPQARPASISPELVLEIQRQTYFCGSRWSGSGTDPQASKSGGWLTSQQSSKSRANSLLQSPQSHKRRPSHRGHRSNQPQGEESRRATLFAEIHPTQAGG